MAIVGIDLGTTNSLVAHWHDGKPQLIPNALGEVLTPSAVSLGDDAEILVGRAARDRLQTHPQLTAAAFKRAMGTRQLFHLGKKTFRAEELSALVLRTLKADAEAALGTTVTGAVITVPAYFSDAQRQATRIAGELAGLEVMRLINEPTAAAIAYGIHEKPDYSTVLVLDLGGGTFDVSVLEMFDGVMQVHASAGDNHLGGEDFAVALGEAFLQQMEIRADTLGAGERSDVLRAAERFKRLLTDTDRGSFTVNLHGAERSVEWTRQDFERICKPLILRLRNPVERALRDASLATDDLDGVILVGGASRMPLVRSLSAQMLGRLPFIHVNPDEVVALGAAVQVALMQSDSTLEEVVLTDVAPYSLGVGIHNPNAVDAQDLLFSPIIERNTPVPVSRVEQYYTVVDGQAEVAIGVWQGEAMRVRDSIKLGEISIRVPRGPAGEQSIDVRFTYDINGLLEVEVEVKATGRSERVVIQREESPLSEQEVQKRLRELAHLKVHPRENMENVTVMARAERLYQERLGEERDYIQAMLSEFEHVLQQQDPKAIETARKQFSEALDALDSNLLF